MSCVKENNKSITDALIDGGLGYGKICIPSKIVDLISIIVFPPLYVFIYQLKTKKYDMVQVITNLILTTCFYFPGFIHALYIKSNRCGSLFSGDLNKKGDTNVFDGVGNVVEDSFGEASPI